LLLVAPLGCSSTVDELTNGIDCQGVCKRYADCFNSDYASMVAPTMSKTAQDSDDGASAARTCNACIGDRSCTGATFTALPMRRHRALSALGRRVSVEPGSPPAPHPQLVGSSARLLPGVARRLKRALRPGARRCGWGARATRGKSSSVGRVSTRTYSREQATSLARRRHGAAAASASEALADVARDVGAGPERPDLEASSLRRMRVTSPLGRALSSGASASASSATSRKRRRATSASSVRRCTPAPAADRAPLGPALDVGHENLSTQALWSVRDERRAMRQESYITTPSPQMFAGARPDEPVPRLARVTYTGRADSALVVRQYAPAFGCAQCRNPVP